jgi:dTDP-4-amino-4,6-dideoxygalactose transaminase
VATADLLAGVRGALTGRAMLYRLAEAVRARFGVQHVRFAGTGRAALAVALTALARLSPRRRVVIPAYTSFSVPAAVVRAGLHVTLCDVDPRTLDFDLDALPRVVDEHTLAVMPNHLFGFPGDVEGAGAIAKARGAFLVEDAAQAAGALYHGRPAGTCADVGLYSLGRGKNITAVNGGILVTHRPEIARAIDEVPLAPVGRGALAAEVTHALALAVLLRPSLFWLPERLPGLELGVSTFAPDFALEELSPFRAGLARAMLTRLPALTASRRTRAMAYQAQLTTTDVATVTAVDGAEPAYLRFPVLARNGVTRRALLEALKTRNLGVSPAYPSTLAEIAALAPSVEPAPGRLTGARAVAERLLTLPTHPFVRDSDVARICEVLASAGARRELVPSVVAP